MKIKRNGLGWGVRIVGVVLLYLASTCAVGQNVGRWYTVEVLIFKRLGAETQTSEIWPSGLDLSYPGNYRYIQARSAQRSSPNFTALPANARRLGSHNYALNNSERYQPLFHRAWKQKMQNARNAPAIIVQGGERIGDLRELSGYIKIHVSRFLHVNSDLWLITDGASVGSRVPLPPGTTTTALSPPEIAYRPTANLHPVATLRSQRRMRSKELHYVDHPLMGMLILITPLG